MNRPELIRRVYAELNQSVGTQASSSELLQVSADLVELMDAAGANDPQFSLRTGGVPFDQWTLDVAMADGGWRVMSREQDIVRPLYADERDSISNGIEVEQWLTEHAA